jgi:hypothetical protein
VPQQSALLNRGAPLLPAENTFGKQGAITFGGFAPEARRAARGEGCALHGRRSLKTASVSAKKRQICSGTKILESRAGKNMESKMTK